MDLNNVHRIAQVQGNGLNPEEFSGLEVAMVQRKLQENLPGRMYFWGKIFGTTQDYLIVHHIDPFAEFPEKKFYFCTTSDFVLRAAPHISEQYAETASKIRVAFTGDPSFFAYNGEEEEPEPEDPDAAPVERFREVHRLTYTVKLIDRDCALVPRGAVALDSAKKVVTNANFAGLSFETSTQPRAYMHMRQPMRLKGIALMKRPGILKTDDFMDCIDEDSPKEMWAITHDNQGATVHVRNLYWDGFSFFAALKTSDYGCAYFGNGVPFYDLAFML